MALVIIASGLFHIATGTVTPLPPQPQAVALGTETLGIVLILRAFASGSVALTGVEAIANGVPAFKPPEAKNAGNTMLAMAVLLGVIFIGVTVIARAYDIVPSVPLSGGPTVIALVAQTAFGSGTALFYIFQLATALILFLAANTSFNAFPRLAAILAEDGYFPRQFSFRGDRLAYSWGIILLAAIAAGLYVVFQGNTTSLIPLYSVGVFVCFTLSQSGMVLHWFRGRDAGWRWRLMVNASRRAHDVRGPRDRPRREVRARRLDRRDPHPGDRGRDAVHQPPVRGVQHATWRSSADYVVPAPNRQERAIVPVPSLNRAVVQALNVARSITDDVSAVFISEDPEQSADMRARWERQVPGVPLVIVESPYRALAGPLMAYLDVLDRAWPPDKAEPITFVVIPEYVARHWWERILYNQSAQRLRSVLLGRPHTVVVDVPYRRDDSPDEDRHRRARWTRNPPSGPPPDGIPRAVRQVASPSIRARSRGPSPCSAATSGTYRTDGRRPRSVPAFPAFCWAWPRDASGAARRAG